MTERTAARGRVALAAAGILFAAANPFASAPIHPAQSKPAASTPKPSPAPTQGKPPAAAAPSSAGVSWTQWRGAQRDGHSSVTPPANFAASPSNVWKIDVGAGHSSPLVADGRVYLHTRKDDQETVAAFDLTSGKTLWTERYAAPLKIDSAASAHGPGPKSTPTLVNGKLYTFGLGGILTCYDAATGAVKWRKSFEKEFPATNPIYGHSVSPLVDQGLLIVHVGGENKGALRAFDPETGATKWSWAEDGPGYASPLAIDIAGTRQIITQTQKFIVSVAHATGQTLWKLPFTTAYDQNVITPVVYKDLLIFSGENKGTFAVRVTKQGATWQATEVWKNPEISMYMSSPVIDGDTLYGLSHRNKGMFFAMDAATGKTHWTSPPRQGDNAAIVSAGKFLFILTDEAKLIVAEAAPAAWKPVKTWEVASSATWAHPVVLGDRVLIKDVQSLALVKIGA
jgi:outer membrane protein assembly factor BamB